MTASMSMGRLLPCVLLLLAGSVAVAEPRVALVIGNSEYASGPLANPANDAKLIGEALTGLGFEVVTRRNADQTTMKRAIQDFGARLDKAGAGAVGLFYYAGHGVQMSGRNYLIPTAARIEREGDVDIEAVSADWVIEQMRYARNRLNIVVLDACRNNPFARSMRSADRGLAVMDAPAGIMIAYSTAPGSVAADGDSRNSPYTEALTRAMRDVHEPVEQVFKRVRIQVMTATSGRQIPWESSSLTGDFYFSAPSRRSEAVAPSPSIATSAPPPPAARPAESSGSWLSSLFNSSSKPAPAGPAPSTAPSSAPSTAPAAGASLIAGARVLPMLQSLGVDAATVDAAHSYAPSTVRQLIETAPRRVSLGSTPEQIRAAFTMCKGYSAACRLEWYADEGLRSASLAPFELDATPVSVGAFRQFVGATHYTTEAEATGFAYGVVSGKHEKVSGGTWRNAVTNRPMSEELAVVGVTYQDAVAYCHYRGERLPSEDEWEYAARGPERRTFPWGENEDLARAAPSSPPRVSDGPPEGIGGRYRGLADNVWEWVDPKLGGKKGLKMLKGGSWLEPNPAHKRAASRRDELPHRADEDSGFRCARSLAAWPDAATWVASLSK
jgi:formylglycine-generating enzyme required for sulfatase activity